MQRIAKKNTKRRATYSEIAKQKRAAFSQNFLKNKSAAKRAFKKALITQTDVVIEIGPGSGILTHLLAEQAKKVIAFEKDLVYGKKLQKEFAEKDNVDIHIQDFMKASLPRTRYVVFANPPFSIFNLLIKKLVFSQNPPNTITLFAQREAAERLTMKHRAYELGVMTSPWFEYQIIDQFRREDFSPQPNVTVVLLQIHKRPKPLSNLLDQHITEYQAFIKYIFKQQKKHLEATLKELFTHEQWKRIAHDLHFPPKVLGTQLSIEQWVALFEKYIQLVSEEKKQLLIH